MWSGAMGIYRLAAWLARGQWIAGQRRITTNRAVLLQHLRPQRTFEPTGTGRRAIYITSPAHGCQTSAGAPSFAPIYQPAGGARPAVSLASGHHETPLLRFSSPPRSRSRSRRPPSTQARLSRALVVNASFLGLYNGRVGHAGRARARRATFRSLSSATSTSTRRRRDRCTFATASTARR